MVEKKAYKETLAIAVNDATGTYISPLAEKNPQFDEDTIESWEFYITQCYNLQSDGLYKGKNINRSGWKFEN
jgi:hypothetical protein